MKKKIMLIFGTRPEAIKMAPVYKELKQRPSEFQVKVCVTAQHRKMLDDVLDIFGIKPEYDLDIMQEGQSLFYITSEALTGMQNILAKEKPDLILVHGDTTTTFTASLAAFYLQIPVGHVEAGLRSYDMRHPFPEEANRRLTDSLSTLCFAPTNTAKKALLKENINKNKIFVTGNTVIDALYWVLSRERSFENNYLQKLFTKRYTSSDPWVLESVDSTNPRILRTRGQNAVRYILVTCHRRENFGKPLKNIFRAFKKIADEFKNIQIIYPVHLNPNVQKPAKSILSNSHNIHLLPPVNYSDLAKLMELSDIVVTDSGGLQEEAPSLGKPVLVLRKVTERPEAVKAGTVKVVGTDFKNVYSQMKMLVKNKNICEKMAKAVNPYGDGKAAYRTIEAIRYYFNFRKNRPEDFK